MSMTPSSERRPRGHQPPQGKPSSSATSSAARSTPVCPPETILSRRRVLGITAESAALAVVSLEAFSGVAGWGSISATVANAAEPVKPRDTSQALRVETAAGTGSKGTGLEEGAPTATPCTDPFAVAFDENGQMYVAEAATHVIVRVTEDRLERFAGTGEAGDELSERLTSSFREPYDLEFNNNGSLFVVERLGHRLRRIDRDGHVHAIAGLGEIGGGESAGQQPAGFHEPHDLCLAPDGNLFVCDTKNHRICYVSTTTGSIATVDLEATRVRTPKKQFRGPRVVVQRENTLYVAFREANTVYKMQVDGPRVVEARLIAGTGKRGYTGDGGPARQATLGGPKGMDVDTRGNVFIADTENHTVRRIDAKTGDISTIVGDGIRGDGPDGDPLACRLNRPHGITFGPDGHLYIADSLNHRVRRVVFGPA